MIDFLIFIGSIIGIVGIVIGLVYLSIKADEKERQKEEAKLKIEGEAFLKEEEAKPDQRLVITTKSGKVLEGKVCLAYYRIRGYSRMYLEKCAALELAHHRAEKIVTKERYFHEDSNLYIPLCEIESVQVVAVEQKS